MKLKEWKKYHFSLLGNEVTRSIYIEKSVVQLYYQLPPVDHPLPPVDPSNLLLLFLFSSSFSNSPPQAGEW
jgi:hypothetical protein